MRKILRGTARIGAVGTWASACATQYIAYQLGFSDILGQPLIRWAEAPWVPLILSHAGAGLAGLGIGLLRTGGRAGPMVLGGASVLLLLATGPVYSPHQGIRWAMAMTGESALTPVLTGALLSAVAGAAWGGGLAFILNREGRRRKRRWAHGPLSPYGLKADTDDPDTLLSLRAHRTTLRGDTSTHSGGSGANRARTLHQARSPSHSSSVRRREEGSLVTGELDSEKGEYEDEFQHSRRAAMEERDAAFGFLLPRAGGGERVDDADDGPAMEEERPQQ